MNRSSARQFASDVRGNIAMMFALSMPIFVLGVGLALDYARAASARTKILAAADAASLAGVTPAMQSQSDAAVQAAVLATFNAEVANLTGFSTFPTAFVRLSHPLNQPGARKVTVDVNASLPNMFAGLIGMTTTGIGGSSTAISSYTPNIDFYVLADSSASMAVVATSTGIATMQNHTPHQWNSNGGCAFACHESNPDWETQQWRANPQQGRVFDNPYYNPNNLLQNCAKSGQGYPQGCVQMDDYALARSLSLTLRIDNVKIAMQSLATTAQTTASQASSVYNMALYSFDSMFRSYTNGLTNPAAFSAAVNNVQVEEYQRAGILQTGVANADSDTDSSTAFSRMNGIIPNPGMGTNQQGDTPQAFLFIITDGVSDVNVGGTVHINPMDITQCAAMKARGVQIGVVYTTYYPIPTYFPYTNWVAPIQSQIAPNMLACASSPTYFAEVNQDGSIADALKTIFQNFTKSARLTGS